MSAPLELPDVPNVQDSEFEVLSLVLWDEDLLKRAQGMLAVEDFWNPANREIWVAMMQMADRGDPVGPLALMQQFAQRGTVFTDRITNLASNRMGDARGLDYHCAKIEEASLARDLQSTIIHFNQRAGADWAAGDLGIGAPLLAGEMAEHLRVIQAMRRAAEHSELDVLDLVQREVGVDDFVIEGLLARGERMILTAAEGWGKSTLFRQLAACVASGVHPFTMRAMAPRRALVIDAENPAAVNTVEWGKLMRLMGGLGEGGRLPARGQLVVEEIGPCNLLEPKQAARILELVERVQPDVIFIGPLYQLFEGDPNDEAPAKILARVLDKARLINNSALVVEAHTPHGDSGVEILRPYGASLWKRWPEFGFCLHDDGSTKGLRGAALNMALTMRESYFTAWRGSRSSGRQWPGHLSAGAALPWETADLQARNQEPPVRFDPPEPEEYRMPDLDLFGQDPAVPVGWEVDRDTGEMTPPQ
jgi:hypothetical protein